jgi:flavodoxin
MNTLIVYDSQFGNTEQVAQAIAETLREYGQVQTVRVEHTHPLYLENVDLLILACPTQLWRPTRAMGDLLDYLPIESLQNITVVCFDTRLDRATWMTGSAAERMTRKLRRRGIPHLLPPESFFVQEAHSPLKSGELERAAAWAHTLHEKSSADSALHVGEEM